MLNLVTPLHVAFVRARIDEEAAAAGRPAPRLAVWVPVALEPGQRAVAQLASQLAIYVGAPGYGELFAKLGFQALVDRARAGSRRAELAGAIPLELITQIAAVGTPSEIATRIAAYHEAGGSHVAVAPSTAEDPAGRGVLSAVAQEVARDQRELFHAAPAKVRAIMKRTRRPADLTHRFEGDSVSRALALIGDQWTLLILREALFGVRRYGQLARNLGIPRPTLSARLRSLVDSGLLERVAYAHDPERHEYRLTRGWS